MPIQDVKCSRPLLEQLREGSRFPSVGQTYNAVHVLVFQTRHHISTRANASTWSPLAHFRLVEWDALLILECASSPVVL